MSVAIDKKKMADWLNTNWKGEKVCPVCSNNQWSVSDKVQELREFRPGGRVFGGKISVLPVVPVTCQLCGYTIFFNAIRAGFVKRETPEPPASVAEAEVEGNGPSRQQNKEKVLQSG